MSREEGASVRIGNDELKVVVAPQWGGCITAIVSRRTGHNHLLFVPPKALPEDSTVYVSIGGWQDFVMYKGQGSPGPVWNKPYDAESFAEDDGEGLRLVCEAGGVRVTRTLHVPEHGADLAVNTRYENTSSERISDIFVFPFARFQPGGEANPESAVLIPRDTFVKKLEHTAAPARGQGAQDVVVTNWWAYANPATQETILISLDPSRTWLHYLGMDDVSALIQTLGPNVDLEPGQSTELPLTVHYLPVDLTASADLLGATRFLPAERALISVKMETKVIDTFPSSISVNGAYLPAGECAEVVKASLKLFDPNGNALVCEDVIFSDLVPGEVSSAQFDWDFSHLDDGNYLVELLPEGAEAGARWVLIVNAQRKKESNEKLDELAARAEALDSGSLHRAVVEWDIESARHLSERNALHLAERYLSWAEDNLNATPPREEVTDLYPDDFKVHPKWMESVEKAVAELPQSCPDPDHYGASGPAGGAFESYWHYRETGANAYLCSWAFLCPDSCQHGNLEALRRAILAADYAFEGFTRGRLGAALSSDQNIARFTLAPLGDAVRLMRHLPIGPARLKHWLSRLRSAVDYQIESYGNKPKPQGGYANQDLNYLLVMRLAHILLGDERCLEQCEDILDMTETQLLPDGAFMYNYPNNEVLGYHGLNLEYLVRDWQLSGDERSRGFIERSVNYYPLSVTPEGYADPASDTWWKHTWGRAGANGLAIAAALTGDGRNQYLLMKTLDKRGVGGNPERTLHSGLVARDDIEPVEPADNWIVLDRNVNGPRARFGRFSWVGTTTPFRDTMVGCMVESEDGENAWAMHWAGAQVFVTENMNPDYMKGDLRMSNMHYPSDVKVQDTCAGLAARCYLCSQTTGFKSEIPETDWYVDQLWYFDAERLVGLMQVEAVRDTNAFATDLSVRFCSFEAHSKEGETAMEKAEDGDYVTGPLRLRVITHSFSTETIEPTRVTSYMAHRPGIGFFGREFGKEGGFEAGTRYYLLAEVRPDWSGPADIARLDGAEPAFTVSTPAGVVTVRRTGEGDRMRCIIK